jgi:glutamate/tyrosine decarboxylase-like PLP-dependent enzyme
VLDAIEHRVQRGPVTPDPAAVAALASMVGSLDETGVGLERALTDFNELLLPASMATASPRYLGLLTPNVTAEAFAGEVVTAALNNNAGSVHQAPAVYAAETEFLRSLVEQMQLGGELVGQIVAGGTMANLHGILLARQRLWPEWDADGPWAVTMPLRIYTSSSSHFSVERAARVAGFGKGSVVTLPSRERGVLDPRALANAIRRDRARGTRPVAVVATAGTTGTGAIDSLQEIAAVCRDHGLWLHVDACYGGGALLLPELRERFAGIECADSIAIDPHKWLFMPLVCGVVLTRHPGLEVEAFSIEESSYLPRQPGVLDVYRRGVATSRRATGLSLWLALRAHGWAQIRTGVRRSIAMARRLAQALARDGFEILPGGELSTVCARWPLPDGEAGDALQEEIAARAVASGQTWFATVRHAGRTWLRLCVVNQNTDERAIDAVAGLIRTAALDLAPGQRAA